MLQPAHTTTSSPSSKASSIKSPTCIIVPLNSTLLADFPRVHPFRYPDKSQSAATMSHSRTLPLLRTLPRSYSAIVRRTFTTTRPAFVNVGDPIPDLELVEGSPGNKVNLAKELKGKGIVIGVPAAFSTSPSIPYINASTTCACWQRAFPLFGLQL